MLVNLDPGLVVVVVAVLVFYLRLIVMQRQRASQLPRSASGPQAPRAGGKRGKNAAAQTPQPAPAYTILSSRRRDRWIGGAGALLVGLGLLLYAGIFPSLQAYWWIPMAVGIVAFSWLFRL